MRTLLSMAFRPFFLLAGAAAVGLVLGWLLALGGAGPPGVDALWVGARGVRLWVPGSAGAVDAGFLVALAILIAVPIYRTGTRRNAWFPVLLVGMAGADAPTHVHPAHAVAALRLAALCALFTSGRWTRRAISAGVKPARTARRTASASSSVHGGRPIGIGLGRCPRASGEPLEAANATSRA